MTHPTVVSADKMLPTICALVPTYNRANYLAETLHSLLAQTRRVDEIIVINDGSTDNTEEVVRSFGDRVRLISKPNGGKSSALNLALAHTQADYIWICDDDDLALPHGLAALAGALDADPEVGVSCGRCKLMWEKDGQRVEQEKEERLPPWEPSGKLCFLRGMVASQMAILARRSLYQQVGPFREDLIRSQDYNMALRLTRWAKVAFVPDFIFLYRQHDGARGSSFASFAGEERVRRWMEAECGFVRDIRASYAIEEFCPTFAKGWEQPLKDRACLLERGCIAACRNLWAEAISDFRQAAELSPVALKDEETRLLEDLLFAQIALPLATDRAACAALRRIARTSAVGRQIVFALLHHLPGIVLSKIRRAPRDLKGGVRLLMLLVGSLGPVGVLQQGTRVLLKRL